MKIAVASVQNDKNSEVSDIAGRAPYYLIFNEELELVGSFENPFAEQRGGAGVAVAKMLAEKGVDMVIAGTFGEKMKATLESEDIEYLEKNGPVLDTLEEKTKGDEPE
ncbi:MAG: NifB/NifX family molybdenum-iron cluster-binding protein [Candidatus Paceibacterota bacterium]